MGISFNKSSDLNQKDIENVQSSGAPGPELRTTLILVLKLPLVWRHWHQDLNNKTIKVVTLQMFKSPVCVNEFTGGIKYDQVEIMPYCQELVYTKYLFTSKTEQHALWLTEIHQMEACYVQASKEFVYSCNEKFVKHFGFFDLTQSY